MKPKKIILPLLVVFALILIAIPLFAAGDKYTFIVYGDTRGASAPIISKIIALKPEFVLQSGDLVGGKGSIDDWKHFDDDLAVLRKTGIAFYPALGNHDVGPYYKNEIQEPIDAGVEDKSYYAFTRHNARFIVLSTEDNALFDKNSDQYKWLEKELNADTGFAHIFVMYHKPDYSVGRHGSDMVIRQNLHPLLVKYHVEAVFCGHDHMFYHTNRDGVRYFITGGGGANLYQAEHKDIAVSGDIWCSVHNIMIVDVDGRNVNVTAIEVPTGNDPENAQLVRKTGDKEVATAISNHIIDKCSWSADK